MDAINAVLIGVGAAIGGVLTLAAPFILIAGLLDPLACLLLGATGILQFAAMLSVADTVVR